MYLNRLNKEEQKNYLELAHLAANYNENFANEQKELIRAYRKEMLLTRDDYEIKDKSYDDIINFYKKCSKEERNIVFIEIVSLILSDNNYDEKEKEVIDKIRRDFSISEKKHDELVNKINTLNDTYNYFENFINQ